MKLTCQIPYDLNGKENSSAIVYSERAHWLYFFFVVLFKKAIGSLLPVIRNWVFWTGCRAIGPFIKEGAELLPRVAT